MTSLFADKPDTSAIDAQRKQLEEDKARQEEEGRALREDIRKRQSLTDRLRRGRASLITSGSELGVATEGLGA